jgi:hypothetical protein
VAITILGIVVEMKKVVMTALSSESCRLRLRLHALKFTYRDGKSRQVQLKAAHILFREEGSHAGALERELRPPITKVGRMVGEFRRILRFGKMWGRVDKEGQSDRTFFPLNPKRESSHKWTKGIIAGWLSLSDVRNLLITDKGPKGPPAPSSGTHNGNTLCTQAVKATLQLTPNDYRAYILIQRYMNISISHIPYQWKYRIR